MPSAFWIIVSVFSFVFWWVASDSRAYWTPTPEEHPRRPKPKRSEPKPEPKPEPESEFTLYLGWASMAAIAIPLALGAAVACLYALRALVHFLIY